MRLRYAAASAAIALCAALGVPAAASASSIPWQPFRTQPFTDQPGAVCSFGVAGTIVKDEEQTRILKSYPNGNPKLQEFRGPLYIRYTNMTTGKSAVRNLSGYGWFLYLPDGGTKIFIPSHFGLVVPVGTVGFPPAEWVINGRAEVTTSAGGEQIAVHLGHGTTIENMCDTLS